LPSTLDRAHVAPGGKLAIVDFDQQENLPGWSRSCSMPGSGSST
jgi:hypothetical protein